MTIENPRVRGSIPRLATSFSDGSLTGAVFFQHRDSDGEVRFTAVSIQEIVGKHRRWIIDYLIINLWAIFREDLLP